MDNEKHFVIQFFIGMGIGDGIICGLGVGGGGGESQDGGRSWHAKRSGCSLS